MKALVFVLAAIGILLVSGCTGSTTGGIAGTALSDGSQESGSCTQSSCEAAAVQAVQGSQEQQPAIDVVQVETDKGLYHSAEVMKLAAVITSEGDVPGAVVTVNGINGKMSLSKTVDLASGDNAVGFEYTLPRCNVCGGIREGNYTCTLSASYGDSSSSEDFIVEIKQ